MRRSFIVFHCKHTSAYQPFAVGRSLQNWFLSKISHSHRSRICAGKLQLEECSRFWTKPKIPYYDIQSIQWQLQFIRPKFIDHFKRFFIFLVIAFVYSTIQSKQFDHSPIIRLCAFTSFSTVLWFFSHPIGECTACNWFDTMIFIGYGSSLFFCAVVTVAAVGAISILWSFFFFSVYSLIVPLVYHYSHSACAWYDSLYNVHRHRMMQQEASFSISLLVVVVVVAFRLRLRDS